MKPIRASVTIILIVLFCSCEKNYQIENADTELLIKVQSNGELFMEYCYNESNLVIEEKSKFHYTKHTYDRRNYLIESEFYMDPAMYSSSSYVLQEAMNRKEWTNPDNTEKSLTQRFEYDEDGRLSKKFFIRPGSTNTEYLSFEYENDRIIRQSSYFNNVLRGFTNFYYDQNGNLIKQDKYYVPSDGPTQFQTTTEYEFDDRKNPFHAFKRLMIPGIYTNQNNITKETYTVHFEVSYPSFQKVTINETTYEYDRRGYPVRVNGETEYIYK